MRRVIAVQLLLSKLRHCVGIRTRDLQPTAFTATKRRRYNNQCRLKYCTAFSCFFAAARVLNVPRFLRFPVFGFFFREYNR